MNRHQLPSDPSVLTEVPQSLKRLVRIISRGFYAREESLLTDILIHHPCMKEDDLLDLLKFEKKQLRQSVTILKNDKFIKVRMRVETDTEGKLSRHNYYFINYSVLVNVVKYKVDHMRKRIETGERQSTCRASFICPTCNKTYSDLEADQLFDMNSGTFICTYCNSEVFEEEASKPNVDARALMVKFNENMQPIFALLMQVENLKLSHEILEPEPTDFKRPSHSKSSGAHQSWSGEATKGRGFGDNTADMKITLGDKADDKEKQKERPIWLKESTVINQDDESKMKIGQSLDGGTSSLIGNGLQILIEKGDTKNSLVSIEDTNPGLNAIMKTLMLHEKSSKTIPKQKSSSKRANKLSIMPDEETDSDCSMDGNGETAASKEMAEHIYLQQRKYDIKQLSQNSVKPRIEYRNLLTELISIGNRSLKYQQVKPDDIDCMTVHEKHMYCSLGTQIYNEFFM